MLADASNINMNDGVPKIDFLERSFFTKMQIKDEVEGTYWNNT